MNREPETNPPQDTEWIVLPGSQLTISLTDEGPEQPQISVTGNRRGMISLANIFLLHNAVINGHEYLSISGLSFMATPSDICLSLSLSMEFEGCEGKLTREDKHKQYLWQIHDDALDRVAQGLHWIGCRPYEEYREIELVPDSDATLEFRLTDFSYPKE